MWKVKGFDYFCAQGIEYQGILPVMFTIYQLYVI